VAVRGVEMVPWDWLDILPVLKSEACRVTGQAGFDRVQSQPGNQHHYLLGLRLWKKVTKLGFYSLWTRSLLFIQKDEKQAML